MKLPADLEVVFLFLVFVFLLLFTDFLLRFKLLENRLPDVGRRFFVRRHGRARASRTTWPAGSISSGVKFLPSLPVQSTGKSGLNTAMHADVYEKNHQK